MLPQPLLDRVEGVETNTRPGGHCGARIEPEPAWGAAWRAVGIQQGAAMDASSITFAVGDHGRPRVAHSADRIVQGAGRGGLCDHWCNLPPIRAFLSFLRLAG